MGGGPSGSELSQAGDPVRSGPASAIPWGLQGLVEWINAKLLPEHIVVRSLEEDIFDGLILHHLFRKWLLPGEHGPGPQPPLPTWPLQAPREGSSAASPAYPQRTSFLEHLLEKTGPHPSLLPLLLPLPPPNPNSLPGPFSLSCLQRC